MAITIHYISHELIDKKRWNAGIDNAANGLIYANSSYLDMMDPQWDALISSDYRYLMPVHWRQKWGITYLYQPFGIAQGGLFHPGNISPAIEAEFLNSLISRFRYGHIDLNEGQTIQQLPGATITMRTNFVLPLQQSYASLYAAFSKDAKKNLRRAAENVQLPAKDVSVTTVVKMYQERYGKLNSGSPEDYERFQQLMENYQASGKAFCTGITDANGELLAAAIIGKDHRRLYYLLGAPTEKGKTYKSVHLLINNLIEQFSGSDYSFDFEGSDIPNVADFYRKFAPEARRYPHVYFNRLPLLLRWLKKY